MSRLVTVIVPAFNAAATIDETLRSVRLQTHAALEILVVDDGSLDDTGRIVAAHAQRDPRIVLIEQPNRGVAAARNRGLELARGDFIALIDADDLWLPGKIARQLEVLLAPGEAARACYTHFRRINAHGFDVGPPQRPRASGDISRALRFGNFIGHCSSILFDRSLIAQIGGFDTSLRDHGAQGCEDIDFFLRLASVTHVLCIPELLTGYREHAGSMSANASQMLRSWRRVEEAAARRDPAAAADLRAGRSITAGWLIARALRDLRLRAVADVMKGHGPGRARLPRAVWGALRQRDSEGPGRNGSADGALMPFRAGYLAGEPAS